jgi:hypothetical protein
MLLADNRAPGNLMLEADAVDFSACELPAPSWRAPARSILTDGRGVSWGAARDVFPYLTECCTTDGGQSNGPGRLTAARELLLGLKEI